ncbi:hypothetical protein OK016_23410 [Vibrio chagasii]|nr:hypothetical protein [Vibrio chagasii]
MKALSDFGRGNCPCFRRCSFPWFVRVASIPIITIPVCVIGVFAVMHFTWI